MIIDHITGMELIPGNYGKDCPANGEHYDEEGNLIEQRCKGCPFLPCCIDIHDPEDCKKCRMYDCNRAPKLGVKERLLVNEISPFVGGKIIDLEAHVNSLVESRAVMMLEEILLAIKNEKFTDFDVVEEIICLYEKNDIDCGNRHNA